MISTAPITAGSRCRFWGCGTSFQQTCSQKLQIIAAIRQRTTAIVPAHPMTADLPDKPYPINPNPSVSITIEGAQTLQLNFHSSRHSKYMGPKSRTGSLQRRIRLTMEWELQLENSSGAISNAFFIYSSKVQAKKQGVSGQIEVLHFVKIRRIQGTKHCDATAKLSRAQQTLFFDRQERYWGFIRYTLFFSTVKCL